MFGNELAAHGTDPGDSLDFVANRMRDRSGEFELMLDDLSEPKKS